MMATITVSPSIFFSTAGTRKKYYPLLKALQYYFHLWSCSLAQRNTKGTSRSNLLGDIVNPLSNIMILKFNLTLLSSASSQMSWRIQLLALLKELVYGLARISVCWPGDCEILAQSRASSSSSKAVFSLVKKKVRNEVRQTPNPKPISSPWDLPETILSILPLEFYCFALP